MAQTLNNHRLVAKAPPSCVSSERGGRSTVGREREGRCSRRPLPLSSVSCCGCCGCSLLLLSVWRTHSLCKYIFISRLNKKGNKKKRYLSYCHWKMCVTWQVTFFFGKCREGLEEISHQRSTTCQQTSWQQQWQQQQQQRQQWYLFFYFLFYLILVFGSLVLGPAKDWDQTRTGPQKTGKLKDQKRPGLQKTNKDHSLRTDKDWFKTGLL